MKYILLYFSIIIFFVLHVVFNVINKNNISETRPLSWLLIFLSFLGFIWVVYYTKKNILRFKFIPYILSTIGILLAFAQVIFWYLFKDFGF